jgi:hypothetical protein
MWSVAMAGAIFAAELLQAICSPYLAKRIRVPENARAQKKSSRDMRIVQTIIVRMYAL